MKIVKSLKESGLLIKNVGKANEKVAKEQNSGFFSILSGFLDASLSENMLAGKEVEILRMKE